MWSFNVCLKSVLKPYKDFMCLCESMFQSCKDLMCLCESKVQSYKDLMCLWFDSFSDSIWQHRCQRYHKSHRGFGVGMIRTVKQGKQSATVFLLIISSLSCMSLPTPFDIFTILKLFLNTLGFVNKKVWIVSFQQQCGF